MVLIAGAATDCNRVSFLASRRAGLHVTADLEPMCSVEIGIESLSVILSEALKTNRGVKQVFHLELASTQLSPPANLGH